MKTRNERKIHVLSKLTADDHLRVQNAIEKRAHELWRKGGCRQTASLRDWLEAEHEVLEEFLRHRFGRHHWKKGPENLRTTRDKQTLGFARARPVPSGTNKETPAYEYYP